MSQPWMPLYIADYLADTSHLNATEHGAYLLLIMHYWRAGSLPQEDRFLARIARMTDREWTKVRPVISAFFEPDWTHKRIKNEMEKASRKSEARAECGSRGGHAKALKNKDTSLAKATILPEQTTKQKDDFALASSSQPESDIEGFQPSIGALGALDPDPADDLPALEDPPPPPEKQAQPKTKRSKPKSKIAPDQQPTEADRRAAAANDLDPATFRAEWARFRDHHLAHGSLMADWSAAWRTWLGNMNRFAPRASPPPRAKSPSFAEIARRLESESHESDFDIRHQSTDSSDSPNGGFTNRISRAAADDGLRVFDFG